MHQKTNLFLITVLLLLGACRENPPVVENSESRLVRTAMPTTVSTPTMTVTTEVAPTSASTPTTVPTQPQTTPTSTIDAITARLRSLEAQFEATYPVNAGWLYRRETLHDPATWETAYTYHALGDDWMYELWVQPGSDTNISQQIMHVYDDEGGLWERSALIDTKNVMILPEQTIDGPINNLDKPLPYRTAHEDVIALLSDSNHNSPWEENGRYHVQIIAYDSRATFSFDLETGAFVQQRLWEIDGSSNELLIIDVNVLETAVVTELPSLAAQTLLDAQRMLTNTGN